MSTGNGNGTTDNPYIDWGFLELYRYYCGRTEVPATFHDWAAIAGIAACVQDRVWIQKHLTPLMPNLYVLLVGPSGLGKGQAINNVIRLLAPYERELGIYAGRITGQALADTIGSKEAGGTADAAGGRKPQAPEPEKPARVFLVAEELALSVGSGPRAHDFVCFMTGLYNSSPVAFRDRTRTSGLVAVKDPCINWLAGTTRDWLKRSVPTDAVEGGFFGRTLVVEAEYDFVKRIAEPAYPSDIDAVQAELGLRVQWLMYVAGQTMLTPEARESVKLWYDNRPNPTDMALAPSWKRAQDMLYKIAMVLALSDWSAWVRQWDIGGRPGTMPMPEVQVAHVIQAQRYLVKAHRVLPELIRMAKVTPATAAYAAAREIVFAAKRIQRSILTKRMSHKGFGGREGRQAVQDLVDNGEVKRSTVGSGRDQSVFYEATKRMAYGGVTVGDLDDDDAGDADSDDLTVH